MEKSYLHSMRLYDVGEVDVVEKAKELLSSQPMLVANCTIPFTQEFEEVNKNGTYHLEPKGFAKLEGKIYPTATYPDKEKLGGKELLAFICLNSFSETSLQYWIITYITINPDLSYEKGRGQIVVYKHKVEERKVTDKERRLETLERAIVNLNEVKQAYDEERSAKEFDQTLQLVALDLYNLRSDFLGDKS